MTSDFLGLPSLSSSIIIEVRDKKREKKGGQGFYSVTAFKKFFFFSFSSSYSTSLMIRQREYLVG